MEELDNAETTSDIYASQPSSPPLIPRDINPVTGSLIPRPMYDTTRSSDGKEHKLGGELDEAAPQEQDRNAFNHSSPSLAMLSSTIKTLQGQREDERRTFAREMNSARLSLAESQRSLESVTSAMQRDFDEKFSLAKQRWEAAEAEKQAKIENLEQELGSAVENVKQVYEMKRNELALLSEQLSAAKQENLMLQRQSDIVKGDLQSEKQKYEMLKSEVDSNLTSWALERRELEKQVANLDTALSNTRDSEAVLLEKVKTLEQKIQVALKDKAEQYTIIVERDELETKCHQLEKKGIVQAEELMQLKTKVARLSASLKKEQKRASQLESDLNLEKIRTSKELASSRARYSIGDFSVNSNEDDLSPEQLEFERSIARWKDERLDLEFKSSALKESLAHSRMLLNEKDSKVAKLQAKVEQLEERCKTQSLQLSRAGDALERSSMQLNSSTISNSVLTASNVRLTSSGRAADTKVKVEQPEDIGKQDMSRSQLSDMSSEQQPSDFVTDQVLTQSPKHSGGNMGNTDLAASPSHSDSFDREVLSRSHLSSTSLGISQLDFDSSSVITETVVPKHSALDGSRRNTMDDDQTLSESNKIIDRILNSGVKSDRPSLDKVEQDLAEASYRTSQEEYLENLIERFLGDEEVDDVEERSVTKQHAGADALALLSDSHEVENIVGVKRLSKVHVIPTVVRKGAKSNAKDNAKTRPARSRVAQLEQKRLVAKRSAHRQQQTKAVASSKQSTKAIVTSRYPVRKPAQKYSRKHNSGEETHSRQTKAKALRDSKSNTLSVEGPKKSTLATKNKIRKLKTRATPHQGVPTLSASKTMVRSRHMEESHLSTKSHSANQERKKKSGHKPKKPIWR